MDIHVWLHIDQGQSAVIPMLNTINEKLDMLQVTQDIQGEQMALDFTNITAEIAENTDAVASAEALLTTLAEEIRASAGNPAALEALAVSLDANNARLAAAVVANTPAAPE